MLYLALGAAVLAFLAWIGRGKPKLKPGQQGWRVLSACAAIAVFAAAAYMGLRGAWGVAIVMAVVGAGLAASARPSLGPGKPGGRPAGAGGGMSRAEAAALLGVDVHADPIAVQQAYSRLMRRAHPDAGGTDGLAAQLNAARDRMLKP